MCIYIYESDWLIYIKEWADTIVGAVKFKICIVDQQAGNLRKS